MRVLLDVQSHFSFFWGTASPTALLRRAAGLGYTHVAIADHAGLYGLPEILEAAPNLGVKPIVAASFPLSPSDHVTALVQDAEGYANLCQAIGCWHSADTAERASPARRFCSSFSRLAAGLAFLATDQEALGFLRSPGAD